MPAKKTLHDYQKLTTRLGIKYILQNISKTADISIDGWECHEGHIFKSSFKDKNKMEEFIFDKLKEFNVIIPIKNIQMKEVIFSDEE